MITLSDYMASLDRTEHMLENGGATAVKVLMRDIRPVIVCECVADRSPHFI